MDFEDELIRPLEKSFGRLFKRVSKADDVLRLAQNNFGWVVVLHGFPFDEGTLRNGGRVGAERAPQAFRDALREEGFYATHSMHSVQYFDVGDLPKNDARNLELSLEEAHALQTKRVTEILTLLPKVVPFLIGGSNDQSYCNACALLQFHRSERFAVVNIDAHFDVRPLKEGTRAHSGSPFRQLLEDSLFQQNGGLFVEFAAKGCSTSVAHFKYLQEKKCDVYWLEKHIRRYRTLQPLPPSYSSNAQVTEAQPSSTDKQKNIHQLRTQAGQLMYKVLNELQQKADKIFFSFDVDSISSEYCPGVSAPSVVGGLTQEEALELAYVAGRCEKVAMIDLSEYNPAVEKLRTGHLLANICYQFCLGVSER